MINLEGKFKHINENGIELLKAFLYDDDFLRYCKILNDDPLNTPIDEGELKSNLIQTRDRNGLVVLKTIGEKIVTNEEVKIYFSPFRGSESVGRALEATYYDHYQLVIVVPSDWDVLEGKGEWRHIGIAQRIAHHIDSKHVAGVGTANIVDWKIGKLAGSPDYQLMTMLIEVENGR